MGISDSAALSLSMVVPTFIESLNVKELFRRLEVILGSIGWEILFVDDDSPDQTAAVVRDMASADVRVRYQQRIGRRGLSSACIEGFLATSAPVIAVMDADLQHDEKVLAEMLSVIENGGADPSTKVTGFLFRLSRVPRGLQQLSTPIHKYGGIRLPMHPGSRRCPARQ